MKYISHQTDYETTEKYGKKGMEYGWKEKWKTKGAQYMSE